MTKFVEFSLFILISKFLFTSHFEISSDYEEIFRQINDLILATIDDVLFAFKISKNFTKSKSVAERIRIHKFIQSASAINYKICKDVYDITRVEPGDKKMEYFVAIIGEITHKVIKSEWGQLKNVRLGRKRNKNAHVNDDDYMPGNNIIIDFAHFEMEYNKGIDTLLTDIVRKSWFAKKSNGKKEQYSKEWEPTKLEPTRRIFDGQDTSIQRFPFMASVLIQARFFCAGCILTKYTVITAASCLRQYVQWFNTFILEIPFIASMLIHIQIYCTGYIITEFTINTDTCLCQYFAGSTVPAGVSITVRVGSDYTGRFGVVIPVEELNFHPLFDRESMDNNLVILNLGKRLKFGKSIRKITIDTIAQKLPENTQNIITLGWGRKSQSDKNLINTQALAYAYTNVYSLEECKNIYSRFYVKDKHFCTGFVNKGSGACNNDIGGPAVVGNFLAGIISFGSPHCGRPDAPTVFTKIGFYAEWISSVVNRIKKEKNMLQKEISESEPDQHSILEPTRNINEEIDSLAQLIGEMQVVQHINTSMNEILKERLPEAGRVNLNKIQSFIINKFSVKQNVKREGEMAEEQVEDERSNPIENDSQEEYDDDHSGGSQSEQAGESTVDGNISIGDVKNDDDLLEVVVVKAGTTRVFKRTRNSRVKYVYSK